MVEAADVLAPVLDDVVVIGAVALVVALSPDRDSEHPGVASRAAGGLATISPTRDVGPIPIAPTRDVDLAVDHELAMAVIEHLTAAGLEPSEEKGEAGFTWQRGDFKVQLMTPPAGRFAGKPKLPAQTALSYLPGHVVPIAFTDEPGRIRLRCASAGALVGLKHAAFGRRTYSGDLVDRDYHDAFQLLTLARRDVLADAAVDGNIRAVAKRVAERLAVDNGATSAAARERLALGLDPTLLAAERAIIRGARRALRDLDSI
jgi:hypothetical protein